MAKNLNSTSFTILLLVLLTASTGIQKSVAQICGSTACVTPKFYQECGAVPYAGTNADCCSCCITRWGSPPVCKAVVEGTIKHCHCYSN